MAVDVVTAYRPKDTDGTAILFDLGRRLAAGAVQGVELKGFQWPLPDGTARYHLVSEGVDVDSLEPELDDIDPNWRKHIERP